MKLIREAFEDVRHVFEGTEAKKHLYLEGIYLQSEVKNRNGRWYPSEILEREVNRYNADYVKTRRAFGELGHPDKPNVNPACISHRIVEMARSGNNWTGKAIVNPEGTGKIVHGIIEMGGMVGMSSRGLGTLKEDKKLGFVVQDDYFLAVGSDIVTDPSAPEAFVNGIMESCDWVYEAVSDSYKRQEIVDLKKVMARAKLTEERKLKAWAKFLEIASRS